MAGKEDNSKKTGRPGKHAARKASARKSAPKKAPKPKVVAAEPAAAEGELSFPVVGVGASAGGLEAFTELLKALPRNPGAAFVLVQHLDPVHESMLSTLLGRETQLPVQEVRDGASLAPDRIYVIPPNTNMALLRGRLHLLPRERGPGPHLPIDYFFRSLAADLGSRAIGVILSGTASDGVLGLKEIKAAGGITFSQDEASAKYAGMPHSAIASGSVDFVLPPHQIAAELARIGHHPYVAHPPGMFAEEELPKGGKDFDKILILMRNRTGDDFTYYKHSTIQRRIKRRMLLHKLDRLKHYLAYLQQNPTELDALRQDILINVTSFFRDPEAFEQLKTHVFPGIVKARGPNPAFRIWVPGCSTGEEAFSVAIALLEYLGDEAAVTPIQIFATDVNDLSIEKARTGVYSEGITQDVSPERLQRFFIKVDEGYQVAKPIRDMCVFARQNVFRDPPFSRLDLISCRNLLIYLGPELQRKVLPVFHYSLNPSGYLLLGPSETIGKFADLFVLVDKKQKIYQKKTGIPAPAPEIPITMGPVALPGSENVAEEAYPGTPWTGADLQRAAERLVMRKYGPAGVVVNEECDILHFRGHTGPFLEPAPGEASLNLMRMARQELSVELRTAFQQAVRDNVVARKAGVRVQRNGETLVVDIEVTPVQAAPGSGRFFLVVFLEREAVRPAAKGKPDKAGRKEADAESALHRQLEQELVATREYLQSVIEQQEVTNEELKSANEEIQSSNEELQSTNEELETAKEELQSTNEELETVNDELAGRNAALEQANSDLSNLFLSTQLPVIILGLDRRIRSFSPFAERLLRLTSADIGRPIAGIESGLLPANLEQTVGTVLETMQRREEDVRDKDGHFYEMRVRPYRTLDNKISGVVITFTDVDALRKALIGAEEARDFTEAIVAAIRHPLLVLDGDLRVRSASEAYYTEFQVNAKETIGNLLYQLGNGQWGIPELRTRLEKVLTDEPFEDFEVEHGFEHIGQQRVLVSGRRICEREGAEPLILMQVEGLQTNG